MKNLIILIAVITISCISVKIFGFEIFVIASISYIVSERINNG